MLFVGKGMSCLMLSKPTPFHVSVLHITKFILSQVEKGDHFQNAIIWFENDVNLSMIFFWLKGDATKHSIFMHTICG